MTTVKLLIAAGALALSTQAGQAVVTAEGLIAGMQAEGYDWIEVTRGPSQFEIEAVRGNEKVEMVIDAASGATLRRETERADREDMARSGTEIRDRNRDFVDSQGRELDDDDHYDRDDDDDDRDRNDDRDDDDDGDDDRDDD